MYSWLFNSTVRHSKPQVCLGAGNWSVDLAVAAKLLNHHQKWTVSRCLVAACDIHVSYGDQTCAAISKTVPASVSYRLDSRRKTDRHDCTLVDTHKPTTFDRFHKQETYKFRSMRSNRNSYKFISYETSEYETIIRHGTCTNTDELGMPLPLDLKKKCLFFSLGRSSIAILG